ncbi:MAG: sugar phosphate nucleotidyltransferase [Nanoarchaeota archaeon]|nr:glycosyltransferase [Nanoarchaeota archaeon]
MKAIILAGGRGSRLNEITKDRNKSMIKLFEKPIIEYNLEQAVELNVKEIVIIVGYRANEIIKYIGKEYKGIKVSYVFQKKQRGLVHAIECAKKAIGNSDFALMLSDEIVTNPDIKGMLKKFREKDLFAFCGVVFEEDKSSISKTYSVMVNKEGRVFRLIEKPRFPINNIKGTGHCILKNEILDYIDRTPINANRGEKELVDMIQAAIDEGKRVDIYKLGEDYVNVNTEEDLNLAKELIKKNNPKVLIVHTQMKFFGGAELLIVELANWLTKRGIKNDILALSKSKEVEDKLINTEIIIPKHKIDLQPPGFKNIKDIFKAIKVFRKSLKEIEKKYDIINFHDFPVTWSLWPRKKPCVWFMNLPPNLYSKPDAGFFLKTLNKMRIWLDRFIVRNSVDVITVAEKLNQTRAMQRYGMKARLIDFGVNYDFFSKGNANKAINKWDLKGKFIVIQSGQIINVKNQLESVKAIKEIKNKIPNVLLILAGKEEVDYRKKIDEYIKKNKLEKHILFTGNLVREELRDLYKTSDVGLFPIGRQGGVLAPFEFLCSGNPIIVSEDIETASLIKKNNLGIVTKEYDKALLGVYKNREKYKQQAKKAGFFIKKNLSWEIFSDKIIKVFKDALRTYKKEL